MAVANARRKLQPGSRSHRIDARREIVLHHVTDGPAKGWLHTHGLASHGKPELEMRNVPLFMGAAGAGLLNDLADYVLNDAAAPFVAGDLVQWGKAAIHLVEGRPDAAGGFDPEHYEDARLVLVDPPESGCACDQCAKELARTSTLHS